LSLLLAPTGKEIQPSYRCNMEAFYVWKRLVTAPHNEPNSLWNCEICIFYWLISISTKVDQTTQAEAGGIR
jgi:hypothetical protein